MLRPLTLLLSLLCLLFGLLASGLRAETVSLIGTGGLDALSLQGEQHGAALHSVTVQHPVFSEALRVEVPARVPKIHEIQLRVTNRAPVSVDDIVLIRLTLRAADGPGARGAGQLFVQDSSENFRTVASRAIEAGEGWEEVELMVPIKKAYFSNELSFALMLGEAAQTLEIARFEVWNLGPQPAESELARLRATALIHHDFEGEFKALAAPKTGAPAITGSIPEGWEEDSAWADVEVRYGPTSSNPHAGAKSFGINATAIRSGTVQFRLPSIVVDPSYQIRLRVATRSPTNTPVKVALRQRAAPYRIYWETSLTALAEWSVSEVLASSAVADPEAVLVFSLDNPGMLEIDELTLTYLTPAQALGNRSFEGNLLPSSSLPLGIAAPWAGGGNGKPDTAYVADPAVPGPSGLPSLRLTTFRDGGRSVAQLTVPFEGRPATPHTFSFWARAAHSGHHISIRVGPPAEQLHEAPWAKSVSLTEEWKRYDFTLTLPPAPDGLYLARINTHEDGVIWVDQLMVEVGDTVSDFQRTGRVELTAVSETPFGLAFEGKPLAYRIAAHGELAEVQRITVSVRDLYDNETKLPDLHIDPAVDGFAEVRGELPATIDLPPLGSFLLEFTAFDANDRPLSRPAELLLHRVREPRHLGRDAPASAFGTHVFPSHAEAALAKALGFNWIRANYMLNWNGLEPRPGEWNFERLDRDMATFRSEHLSILGYLGGVPRRHSMAQDDWRGWWRDVTAAPREESLDAWQDYARRVLERYRDTLAAVETWNEPFLPGFFPVEVRQGTPVRGSPELFKQMTARVRAAATEAGYPGPVLWNMGAAYGASEREFDSGNVALGTADLVDGFTFHRYTNAPLGFPGDVFDSDLTILRETLGARAASAGAKWNSEGGYTGELFNLYRHAPLNYLRSRAEMQAGNFVRYYLSNFAAGVERVFSYAFFPQDGWRSDYSFMHVDGALSHIGPAASNMTWQLEGKRFVRSVTLAESAQAMLFTAADSPEAVVTLTSRGTHPVQLTGLPEGVTAVDIYGNPPVLPAALGAGVMYLRGPGLTPEVIAAHLSVR